VADWPPDYPDEDDANVGLGRFIQEYSYPRERKEIAGGPQQNGRFPQYSRFFILLSPE